MFSIWGVPSETTNEQGVFCENRLLYAPQVLSEIKQMSSVCAQAMIAAPDNLTLRLGFRGSNENTRIDYLNHAPCRKS